MTESGSVRTYQELEKPKPSESKILLSHGTPLACTTCHRINMPFYYLKRCNGLYQVLCFDNGKGCWEHSARGLCSYIDREASQCEYLAEWLISYNESNTLQTRATCTTHLSAMLGQGSEYKVFPIDNEDTLRGDVY
jgi:hypothetical protein